MNEDIFRMQRNPGHNAAGLNGARSDNGIANREGIEAGNRGFAAAPSSDIHGQDDALLDVTEVAEYLRISRSSVYKLIERQQIPAIRIGRLHDGAVAVVPRRGPGARAPGREPLHLAQAVAVVPEERPDVADDDHAHEVEADRVVGAAVRLRQVGSRDPLERLPVNLLLGEPAAAVLDDLRDHEHQVVLLPGDEVDAVGAVRPAVLQNLEAPALQVGANRLHCLLVDGCFHDDDLLGLSARPFGVPCGSEFAGVRGGRKGSSENPQGLSFPVVDVRIQPEKFFAALAPGAVPGERGEPKGTP